MIAEACMMFHWTVDQILKMPARQFFAVKKAAQEISIKQKSMHYGYLCDIEGISIYTPEYFKEIKNYFRSMNPDVPKKVMGRVYDLGKKEEGERAADILKSHFKTMAKLQGLNYNGE